MDTNLEPFEPSISEINREMPIEVMTDFDAVLLFGKLTAVSPSKLTVSRISREVCFPILEWDSIVLVRCYDARMNPILLRARVMRSSGMECTLGEMEMIHYKTHRKDIRYPFCPPAPVSVLDDKAHPQLCQLLNISISGACIVTKELYDVGQKISLLIKPTKTDKCVTYKCKVIRVTPRRGGCFEYGILFAHLSRKQRGYLTSALRDRLHLCSGGQRGTQ